MKVVSFFVFKVRNNLETSDGGTCQLWQSEKAVRYHKNIRVHPAVSEKSSVKVKAILEQLKSAVSTIR